MSKTLEVPRPAAFSLSEIRLFGGSPPDSNRRAIAEVKTVLSNLAGFPRSVFKPGLAGVLAVFLFIVSPSGRAATILFSATDVADTTVGEDLWQHSYSPGDIAFAAGRGFTVVWLGTGAPGSQPFVIYDTDFSTVTQGQTVPEPSALALLLAAQGAAICNRRPKRSSRSDPSPLSAPLTPGD